MVAATPAEAVEGAEVLITMLADDNAITDVLFAPHNALHALPAGAVHISMSTISFGLSRRLVEAHREKGEHYLAAPVMDRPDAAEAAKLFVIAAGPNDQIERCRPIFDAPGQRTFLAGKEAPAANVFKLTANFLITTVIEALAQGMSEADGRLPFLSSRIEHGRQLDDSASDGSFGKTIRPGRLDIRQHSLAFMH